MSNAERRIPVDKDGFYECNDDTQLNFELIQVTLNHIVEQNAQIMEMLVYACPKAQKAKKAIERWNKSSDESLDKLKIVERRYLERNKK